MMVESKKHSKEMKELKFWSKKMMKIGCKKLNNSRKRKQLLN